MDGHNSGMRKRNPDFLLPLPHTIIMLIPIPCQKAETSTCTCYNIGHMYDGLDMTFYTYTVLIKSNAQ